jgi:UDP-N-acetylglucosamine--N-acetylmuramyl-(pentapeptide) pyrophosphoryl-undecaprenol N-acetylglucosamine transferase
MRAEAKLIVLTGGGTGGHMSPAAALARDLISRGFRVEVITDKRGARYENMFGDVPFHVIPAGTLGSGLIGKVRGVTRLGAGILKAQSLLRKMRPAVVVGFGGYPSVPAIFAAQRRGIPTIIHEQNAILGRANAFLASRAARIALSLPYMEGLQASDAARAVITGNPVREDIARLCTKPYPVLDHSGMLRVFIMGGSQGARVFSDIVPAAVASLSLDDRARLEITQQCRPEDLEDVRQAYARIGLNATLAAFFRDVPEILGDTHLMIGRSGASTVAEVTAAGRPALFVPASYHADQQQKVNAQAVTDAGGAWVIDQKDFTPEALRTRLESFLHKPEILFRAAEAARGCGRPDAARRLGNLVTEVASGRRRLTSGPAGK